MDLLESHACFGGTQNVYRHASTQTGTEMDVAVFLPPQAKEGSVPAVLYLSGLTCNWENVTTKAGAQGLCADLGLAFIAPDTSPRGTDLPGEHDDYDFGSGAGFYVDATQAPWNAHYRMESYITQELPATLADLPIDLGRLGITGHSMGGHGALTLALKNPGLYQSISAFAPICAPMQCPWGEKALDGYLGDDRSVWRRYDACALIEDGADLPSPVLVDQGTDDPFLEDQLKPALLEQACGAADIPLTLRMHPGYDHSYYFIASFMDDHLRHHAQVLG